MTNKKTVIVEKPLGSANPPANSFFLMAIGILISVKICKEMRVTNGASGFRSAQQ
jgi:hypothetical protein